MMPFFTTIVLDFFVAMGIVVGGSVVGGLGAVLVHRPPMTMMLDLADQLKIWALVAALGGTMDALKAIDTGVLSFNLSTALKQLFYLISAFIGCNAGYYLIKYMVGEIK